MPKKGELNSNYSRLLTQVHKKHALIEEEIKKVLDKPKEISIPLSVFNEKLGMLEAASLYLKDTLNLSFNEIANYLKRDYKTIWTSYKKARKKINEK